MTSPRQTGPSLPSAVTAALRAYVDWLRQQFGARLCEVKLFGSYARGEASAESDVDLLVVVDDLQPAEARAAGQQAGDALTDFDVVLAPLLLSRDRIALLRERERAIVAEIDRDGVAL